LRHALPTRPEIPELMMWARPVRLQTRPGPRERGSRAMRATQTEIARDMNLLRYARSGSDWIVATRLQMMPKSADGSNRGRPATTIRTRGTLSWSDRLGGRCEDLPGSVPARGRPFHSWGRARHGHRALPPALL